MEVQQLVPLWVGVLLDDLRAQLKMHRLYRSFLLHNEMHLHATAKAVFVLGTFLPAKRASKNGSTRFFLLPSPPNMSFIDCTNASSTGGKCIKISSEAATLPLISSQLPLIFRGLASLVSRLTLGNVLGSVHLQRQCGPAKSHSSRQQQIALNVVLVIVCLPLLRLQ